MSALDAECRDGRTHCLHIQDWRSQVCCWCGQIKETHGQYAPTGDRISLLVQGMLQASAPAKAFPPPIIATGHEHPHFMPIKDDYQGPG